MAAEEQPPSLSSLKFYFTRFCLVQLLIADFFLLSGHFNVAGFRRAVAINQSGEVLRLERVVVSGFLSGRAQRDVHSTVVGKHNRLYFLERLLPVFCAESGILFHLL